MQTSVGQPAHTASTCGIHTASNAASHQLGVGEINDARTAIARADLELRKAEALLHAVSDDSEDAADGSADEVSK